MASRKPTPQQRLSEYRAKRDFTKTPEPSKPIPTKPAVKKQKGLFFCVQKHLASHLHYDFRLEHAGVLLSWAVPKGPSLNPADKRLAMRTEDHPMDYGDFEGVIPEGYGAGIVMLWDQGTWEPENGDVGRGIEKGEIKFRLHGVKLKGSWVIVRTGGRFGGDDGRSWLLIKHRDEWAGDVDVAQHFPLSVKSGGDFDDILAADNPDVWESHQPAKGGAAGAMLRQIIAKAAEKKLTRNVKQSKAKGRAAGKAPTRAATGKITKRVTASRR